MSRKTKTSAKTGIDLGKDGSPVIDLQDESVAVKNLRSSSLAVEEAIKSSDPDAAILGTIALSDLVAYKRANEAFANYPELNDYHGLDRLNPDVVSLCRNILSLVADGKLSVDSGVLGEVVPFAEGTVVEAENKSTTSGVNDSKASQARAIHESSQHQTAEREAKLKNVNAAARTAGVVSLEAAVGVTKEARRESGVPEVLRDRAIPEYKKNLLRTFNAYLKLQDSPNFDSENTRITSLIALKNTFIGELIIASGENESRMDEIVADICHGLNGDRQEEFINLVNGQVAEYLTEQVLNDLKAKKRIFDFEKTDPSTDAEEGTDFIVQLSESGNLTNVRVDAKSVGEFSSKHSLGRDIGREAEFFDTTKNAQGEPVLVFCPDRSAGKPILTRNEEFSSLKKFDSYSGKNRHLLRSTGQKVIDYIQRNIYKLR